MVDKQVFGCPSRVVQWLDYLGSMCSRAWHAVCRWSRVQIWVAAR